MAKTVNVAYPISIVNGVKIDISKKCHSSNYTKVGSRTVRYVVMHYTGNSKDYAWNNANYFTGANRNASAHFFVDDDEIYQSIGLNDKAWHCGDDEYFNDCRNSDSIGIEMCCTAGNYDMSAKTVELAAQLCAALCKYLDITDVDKYVVRHWDVTHKGCPRPMVRNSSRWVAFKTRVKQLIKNSNAPVDDKKETTKKTTSTIKTGSLVSIKSGSKYTNGKDIPDWVEKLQWYVTNVSGSRIVLGKSKDGKYDINSPVDVKYLSVVGATQEQPKAKETKTEEKETCIVELPVLKKGDNNGYVKTVQILLNKYNNARLDEDGVFGSGTYKSVLEYQKSRGLGVDGIVGAKTWAQLLK